MWLSPLTNIKLSVLWLSVVNRRGRRWLVALVRRRLVRWVRVGVFGRPLPTPPRRAACIKARKAATAALNTATEAACKAPDYRDDNDRGDDDTDNRWPSVTRQRPSLVGQEISFSIITHLQYALDMQLSQLEKVCLTPLTSDDMLCRCKRVTNAAMMRRC